MRYVHSIILILNTIWPVDWLENPAGKSRCEPSTNSSTSVCLKSVFCSPKQQEKESTATEELESGSAWEGTFPPSSKTLKVGMGEGVHPLADSEIGHGGGGAYHSLADSESEHGWGHFTL